MAIWDVTDDSVFTVVNSTNFRNTDDDGNFLTDTARDLGVGVIDIGGAVAGLGDLAASPFRDPGDGTFTQAYEDSPLGQWKRELQAGYSAERQAAEQEYQDYVEAGNGELDKFGRAILGAVTSPRVALGRLVQSAPAMAVSGGVGGAVGKATLARGASTNAAKWAGRAGSGAAEGLMSGGQAAGEIAEYNREQGYEPTRGMVAPVMTAAAVGGVGTIGGGMEAGLFNKSLREVGETSARSGWKAIPTTMVKEGFKEGGEEMAQSYFETVPTNSATDKEWNEGLGQSMGEGFAAGFGMGAALGPLSRNRKVEVMSGTEGADATYERSRPPSEAPTVDPAIVAEDAGISMTGDVNADANAYIDANTEPAEEATPATGAAQPAPETTQSTPDVGVEPAAEPEAPEVLQVDEKGYRKLWSGVHDQSRSVSKRLLERTNEVLATPFGKDVVDAMVQANNAVGAHLSTERILNLVDNAIDESGSVEEAIEKLRAQAADQEGRGKNSIPVSDLCAVAAEVLSGNSDPLQFLQGRMGERVVAEAQKARDKSLQKAEAKARARTGGEAPVELKGSADDVFKADDSPQVGEVADAGAQNAPADDVIEAEIVGEREAEPANTQEEVPESSSPVVEEPVASAVQQEAEPAVAQAVEPAPKVDTEPAPAVTAEPEPQPEPAKAAPVTEQTAEPAPEAPKPKAEPAPASESTPVDIDKKAPWVEEKKPVDFGPVPNVERVNHVGDKPGTAGAVPVPKEEVKPKQKRALKTKVSEIEDQKPTPNKGGQSVPAAPAKHTNAVAKGDADQRAHGKAVAAGKAMWNPNEGRKVPANEQGAKVAKSVAEMKPMESFAKAPMWVRQTREFAAKWFKIRGGWPTQEEYRDEIWPRLAEQENWTPAEMVDRRTGNAWTNRYFGDITRGSLKEPIRGTKETIREKKQSRVEAGKEAADRMLKEWAEHKKRLQAKKDAGKELKPFEQAVLDYDKPSEADVRAFALREFQSGNTSMRLYAKDFTADSYEKMGNPRHDRHGANWGKKKNGETSVFKPGYKAEPEDVGTSNAQVPAKVKGTDSALVMKGEEGTNIPDDVKASMELKRLEALPSREAKVKAVIDALRGIEDLPQTGAGSTRMSVTMAAIMATQKAAQLSSHSPAKWTKAQFEEVIEAISDVIHADKPLFNSEQRRMLDNLKMQVLKAAQLDKASAESAARAGAEAQRMQDREELSGGTIIDDRQPKKDEEDDGYNHSYDDDKVGGESGGAANTESGRTGRSMAEGKNGLKAKLARHLKETLGWTKNLKFDDNAASVRDRVKNDAVAEASLGEWFAQQAEAIKPKLAKMRHEDVQMFHAMMTDISKAVGMETNAVTMASEAEMLKRAEKKRTGPDTYLDERYRKKAEDQPVYKAESKAEGFHGDPAITVVSPRATPNSGFFSDVERLFEKAETKTEVGKELKDESYYLGLFASDVKGPIAMGRTLRLSSVVEKATSADDLKGVFSTEFASRLLEAIRLLKEAGVSDFSNIYVTDQMLDESNHKHQPSVNNPMGARVGRGMCELFSSKTRNAIVRTGPSQWANAQMDGKTAVVQVVYLQGDSTYSDGVGKRMDDDFRNGMFVHELVHALDTKSGYALVTAFKGRLTESVMDEFENLEAAVTPLYEAWRKGEPLDADLERATLPKVLLEKAATVAPRICYASTNNNRELYFMDLMADSVAGYLTSPTYRQVIEEATPKFAAALKELIENEFLATEINSHTHGGTGWVPPNWSRVNSEAGGHPRGSRVDGGNTGAGRGQEGPERVRDSSGSDPASGKEAQQSQNVRGGDGDPGSTSPSSKKSSGDDAGGTKPLDGTGVPSERDADAGVGGLPSGRSRLETADVRGGAPLEGGTGSVGKDGRGRSGVGQGSSTQRSVGGMGSGTGNTRNAEGQARKHLRDFAPKGVRGQFLDALLNAADAAKTKLGLGLLFTRDLVNLARKAAPDVPAFKQWHELMERQAAYRNDWQAGVASINERFEALPKAVQPQVNRFLEAVTLEGLWPFRDPDVFATEEDFQKYKDKLSDEQKDILAKLERDYEALPQKARSVVYAVLHHGVESRRTRANLMKGFVEERYGSLIDKATDKTTKAKWEKEKKDWIARCDSLAAQVRAPYVPLRRFGSHVVVRQSKKYEYTKRLAGQVYKTIQERTNGKPTKAQMAPFHKLQAELAKMQGDPEHYEVQFVDGAGTAKRHAKTLQDRYPDAIVESFARAEHVEGSIPSWQKLEQVITSAQQNLEIEKLALDPDTRDATAASLAEIMNAAQRMYIEALNDDNARKSELRRMRVAGYHTNMMENFMETGRSEANLFANMSYGAKVRKVLVDMQQEVKHSGNRAAAADYQNEMLKRHNQMLRGEGTSEAVNTLLRTNSVVMLMTSPAYYLQNLLQPMMMSAPYMAGHHGMAASMEALGKTMAAAAKALRKGTSLEHIEEGMKLTKAEAEALRRARDLGHIDIGMTSDFGHITHSDAGEIKKAFAKVTDKMTEVSRRVEMVNRIGTFIAAYRLENARLKGKNPEAAWQYADEVVYKTHGDYSGINAPRLFAMNSMTKMATQFRKFQLIQAGMMIGLAARAFRNASPAEKALARRQLAWTMGIHFAMAGAKGTPFLATLLGLIGFAFGGAGDDEDDMIRDLIGDKQTSDLVLNGIPKMLGVDMSGKVGASNMFSLFPFMDTKPSEGEDFWKDLVVSAMGPTGSLGERALRGFAYASQGDWAKGAEAVAPTGIANLMKAIRFSTEGVTTKAGDVHILGEEFTLFDGVMQAAGLPTNKTTDRNRIMGSLIRHEEWFDGQQSQLVHDYKEAWKARDSKSMMRLRREFLELNKLRREQGFKPAKMSVMTKAPIKQRKRELQGQGIGSTVGYKPSNRRFIEEQLKK